MNRIAFLGFLLLTLIPAPSSQGSLVIIFRPSDLNDLSSDVIVRFLGSGTIDTSLDPGSSNNPGTVLNFNELGDLIPSDDVDYTQAINITVTGQRANTTAYSATFDEFELDGQIDGTDDIDLRQATPTHAFTDGDTFNFDFEFTVSGLAFNLFDHPASYQGTGDSFDFGGVTAFALVPEPASSSLFLMGLIALGCHRRRRA
ncbi:MAG: PEP-CTERM sorting domain-containing protein [Planctomycetota bacterium]